MWKLPPLDLVLGMAILTFAMFVGLYRLLTRGRRKIVDEVKSECSRRGWEFRERKWLSDPTSFRIDGWTRNGRAFVLRTSSGGNNSHRWSKSIKLTFPRLAGEMDCAILPRAGSSRNTGTVAANLPPGLKSKLIKYSAMATGALSCFQDSDLVPSGFEKFDDQYEVRVVAGRVNEPLVDAALGKRWVEWPSDAVTPKEVLAWRDPFGFHIHAHLPSVPNWPTISYLVESADELASRLPTAVGIAQQLTFWDRLVNRLLES